MYLKENDHSQDHSQVKKMVVISVVSMMWLAFNMEAHADSILDPLNIIGSELQDKEAGGNALSDQVLSSISGMGVEAQRIEAGTQLAVILWDERGNSSRRQSASMAEGKGNLQTVSVTVSWK